MDKKINIQTDFSGNCLDTYSYIHPTKRQDLQVHSRQDMQASYELFLISWNGSKRGDRDKRIESCKLQGGGSYKGNYNNLKKIHNLFKPLFLILASGGTNNTVEKLRFSTVSPRIPRTRSMIPKKSHQKKKYTYYIFIKIFVLLITNMIYQQYLSFN